MNSAIAEENIGRIPARSKKQAMDWSLVLITQEIPSTIIQDESGWNLSIAETDLEKARNTIALYIQENRHWKWQRPLPGSSLLFHSGAAFWCLWLVVIYYWSEVRLPYVKRLGLMDSQGVNAGEWWRLFTAITLHGDLAHLIANLSIGFILLGLAMARYGSGLAVMAAYLAGAMGNVFGWMLYPAPHKGLGASGMVMGALGLISVQTFFLFKNNFASKKLLLRSASGGLLMLTLLGFSPETDIVAHVGGFVSGAMLGCGLNFLPEKFQHNSNVNKLCHLLLIFWLILTWHFATR